MKRILCGEVALVFWMTPGTSDTFKQILIETGHNETAQERHAVHVKGCIMTTYLWVRQKSGEFTLWSSFQLDMAGAELPYNRGAQFVAMPVPTGSQDTAIVYFQMRRPFEARFEKSNLRGKEVGSILSPRNDGTTHSCETSVSFFYMHYGQDVIAKADRFTRAFEDYRPEHCLLLG